MWYTWGYFMSKMSWTIGGHRTSYTCALRRWQLARLLFLLHLWMVLKRRTLLCLSLVFFKEQRRKSKSDCQLTLQVPSVANIKFLLTTSIHNKDRLVPSRHLFILAKEYGKAIWRAQKRLGRRENSSFLPLIHRELTKSFPLITAHTEKRLDTSLYSREKVMRINKIITEGKKRWSFIVFSQLILLENV